MKQCLVLVTALVGISQICAAAAACGSGTLGSYVSLGSSGCMVGSDTLFNFQVLPGTAGASEISPLNVTLAPFAGSSSVGLSAATNVTSAAGVVQEFLFTYQLSGSLFSGSTITLSNSSETGDGAVTGLKNFCAGGSFGMDGVSGCTGTPGGLATVDGVQNQDSGTFMGASLLSVTDDVTIDGGTAGSANGGTFLNEFATTSMTPTPEPTSLLLTGVALAFAGGWRFRSILAGRDRR